MLGRSACQHTWIIDMCSIRAKLCFIHICPLRFHPYWLCMCQVCSCMHLRVLELCMYVHVLKTYPYLCLSACIIASAFVGSYRVISLNFSAVGQSSWLSLNVSKQSAPLQMTDLKHLATTCVWLEWIFLHSRVFRTGLPCLLAGSLAALPMWQLPPSLRLVLPAASF